MKKFKRILCVLMLQVFLFCGLATSKIAYAAINDQTYLKAVHIRKEGWGYSLREDGAGNLINNIEKIKSYTSENGTTEKNSIFYCIKAGIGFGAGENTVSIAESSNTTTYTELGDFTSKITLNQINANYENYLNESNYYNLIWLLDNIYTKIGVEDEASKANYLTSIGGLNSIRIYKDKNSERADLYVPYMETNSSVKDEDKYTWSDIINDDDIDVIQQLAIWHFTNAGEDYYDLYQEGKGDDINQLVWIKLINSLSNTQTIQKIDRNENYGSSSEITEEQYRNNQIKNLRYTFLRNLYANLIEKAKLYGNEEYFNSRSNELNDVDLENVTARKNNGYYIAGPYSISEEYKSKNYTLTDINFKDGNGNIINDKINILVGNTDLTKISDVQYLLSHIKNVEDITKDDILNGNMYIAISTNNTTSIDNIEFDFKLSSSVNNITYYSAGNETQPVIKIDPEQIEIAFAGEITIPKTFDLALRKYITKVTKTDSTVNELTGDNSRVPKLSSEDIAKIEVNDTADYKHRKDPVTVETGDKVTYNITIYNEGNQDGYATKIVDQLPEGLKFSRVVSGNFEKESYGDEESGDNKLILKRKTEATSALQSFKGQNIDSEIIEIECEVTATPDSTNKKILTNVAWILEEKNTQTGVVITNQQGQDRDSEPQTSPNVNKTNMSEYKGDSSNPSVLPASSSTYYKGNQDDDDFEKLQLLPKTFDLALRKFITQITKVDNTVQKMEGSNTREPQIEQEELEKLVSETASFDNGKTVTKTHTKNPIVVETGDIVRYTIRIYNEGQVNGKADEITDYLPEGLELVSAEESEINQKYGWKVDSENSKKITTDYLSKASAEYTDPTLKAFSSKKENDKYVIDYKDVQIECKVTKTVSQSDQKLKNVAEITKSSNVPDLADRDSVVSNANHNANNDNYNPTNPTKGRGEQDDDDYEELVLKGKYFDLALRKFITQINDEKLSGDESREPVISQEEMGKLISGTSNLDNGQTATKIHTKDPVEVKTGDIVRYTIRVYNEGQVDGKADEITDYLPEGLELVSESESEINKKYGWKVDSENSKKITTDYLSKTSAEYTDPTLKALSSKKVNDKYVIDYKDVQIECKVTKTASQTEQKLKNVAEITKSSNDSNLADRDSVVSNVNHNENNDNYNPTNPTKGRGEQDDDDYEELKLSQFDLALRKFITAIDKTEITTRIPKVDTSKLKDGTKTTAEYTHTKEPLLVKNSSVVTYTIRIYNEGEIDGYASKIKDDMPEGLEFIIDNETNKEYRWVMLDKDGKETEKISEAKSIVTDYLSKEQETERKKNDKTEGEKDVTSLIKAYDKENDKISYKDVKVAFKVIEPNTSDRILKNEAQISENTDKNGKTIVDRDSIPDEWKNEDDEDIEKIKVQYFDLSLRKWVTQAIIDDNGTVTTTETNHKAEDDPESIVKVEIKDKKLNSVSIKFKYKIRVTNEGTIAGYATEIKDYIPEGLKFVAEDNKNWKQLDDKTIVTDQAKNTLLQTGESTEVEVILTWINSERNLDLQVNYAEISNDFNEFDAPDIDSTPDNKKDGEDDIDEAPVLLSIKTGEAKIYFIITGSVLLIFMAGIILIKKYIM